MHNRSGKKGLENLETYFKKFQLGMQSRKKIPINLVNDYKRSICFLAITNHYIVQVIKPRTYMLIEFPYEIEEGPTKSYIIKLLEKPIYKEKQRFETTEEIKKKLTKKEVEFSKEMNLKKKKQTKKVVKQEVEETDQESGDSLQSNIEESSAVEPKSEEEEEATSKKKLTTNKPPKIETYKRKDTTKEKKKLHAQQEEEEQEKGFDTKSLKSTKEGKKLSLKNMIEDVKNNGNYNTIRDIFLNFNNPSRIKIVHFILVSFRAFSRMAKNEDFKLPEELSEIINKKWSKAIFEWKCMLDQALTNIRPDLNNKEVMDLIDSCR